MPNLCSSQWLDKKKKQKARCREHGVGKTIFLKMRKYIDSQQCKRALKQPGLFILQWRETDDVQLIPSSRSHTEEPIFQMRSML